MAAKRVALVVGNSAYVHTTPLQNPKNDATDIAAALKQLGFEVIDGFDLNKSDFERKVRAFSAALQGAEAGVFFYAGHGLQVAGQNYLVPVDAKAETADALDWEMLRLDLVHRTMERSASTNIIFLDACRNNPLARNLARAMGTRSTEIGRGLAPVESGVGTLISFSTQPGNVALDGSGRNSPFAGALVKRIASSSDDLSALLIDVRNDVRKDTQNKQIPWEHSALTGRFYFTPPQAAPPAAAPAPPLVSEAERTWAIVQSTKSIAVLEDFIIRYKDSIFAKLAQERIEELKKQQVAVATPPKVPALAKAAEPAVAVPPTPPPVRCDGVETTVGRERRCLKPKDSFKDCDICPEMVVIPAGRFTMGSPDEEPERSSGEAQVQVTIASPFAVGRFAATFAEWDACVADGGCNGHQPIDRWGGHQPIDRWGRGNHPVTNVNWDDAKAFAAWLSKRTGKAYRLLSESEREYVTRAGTTTPFWWGATILTTQANYDGNYTYAGGSKGLSRKATVPVNSFNANAWGLYNVHGNVWEWTEDCWNASNKGNSGDGRARTTGECNARVVLGGSCLDPPRFLRSAHRNSSLAVARTDYLGFRLARTLSP
jgi:formylglycine-generating enzyme required for sulfatase activity